MAKKRKACGPRMIILVIAGLLGLVIFIAQMTVFSYLNAQQAAKERARQRIWNLRLEENLTGQAKLSSNEAHFSTKVVLMHSFPYFYELKSGRQAFSACNRSCVMTLDADLASEVDCVVLYAHHHASYAPALSGANQIWVYFAVESPVYSGTSIFARPGWHNRFNLTMTYRRDSDFYFGYGDFKKNPPSLSPRNFAPVVKGKSRMVAWFASNCHTQSKRGDFVAALKEFIQVDIYGGCGDLKCAREQAQTCLEMLSKDYYFYLSFENSLCQDYVTEKLYHILKMVDIIPVVRGRANYTSLLPKNSFIDVAQFATVQALANHLKRIASNKEVYASYLAWKNDWQVIEPMPFPFCDLCYKLHHTDQWSHVYANMDSWWREGICLEPPSVIKS